MSLVGFKANNHKQQVKKRGADEKTDDRRTLPELFDPLNRLHGFTLDAAASPDNAKCEKYFTKEHDGLLQSWRGEVVWCNPPYSNLGDWCGKARHEVMNNGCKKVVMLLPANRCEQAWWQFHIEPFRDKPGWGISVLFLAGRHRFGWPPGRVVPPKGDRPPFGLVLVTFTKEKA